MNKLIFEADTLLRIRSFPVAAKHQAAYEIERVQRDKKPENGKLFTMAGHHVWEVPIQIYGQFHVLFLSKIESKVHVLHVFEKKSKKTRQPDIDLAIRILNKLVGKEEFA